MYVLPSDAGQTPREGVAVAEALVEEALVEAVTDPETLETLDETVDEMLAEDDVDPEMLEEALGETLDDLVEVMLADDVIEPLPEAEFDVVELGVVPELLVTFPEEDIVPEAWVLAEPVVMTEELFAENVGPVNQEISVYVPINFQVIVGPVEAIRGREVEADCRSMNCRHSNQEDRTK